LLPEIGLDQFGRGKKLENRDIAWVKPLPSIGCQRLARTAQ
jgi:hypothetical protein